MCTASDPYVLSDLTISLMHMKLFCPMPAFNQDPEDGTILICDTDGAAVPWFKHNLHLHNISSPATIPASAADWAESKHGSVLVDPVHIVLNTFATVPSCRHVMTLVPELLPLAREVEERHLRLEAGCPGATQLQFDCVRKQLPARPLNTL